MQRAALLRLHPRGPWRFGAGDGSGAELDALYRSDRLFSALTIAFADLGYLDTWLNATARTSDPAVALSSLFPFQAETLFIAPPHSLWPPPASLVTSPSPVFLSKLRWNLAHFVPVSLVQSLLLGQPALAEQWAVDAESGCLLRRDRPSAAPFRFAVRGRSAVDRPTRTSVSSDRTRCIEFDPAAGLWVAIAFRDQAAEDAWRAPLESAFRLLADTGLGAARRIGWGQFVTSAWQFGNWPALLFPKLQIAANGDHAAPLHWLLSLYSPGPADQVNWDLGNYRLASRGGRTYTTGLLKKTARMITEGSVVSSPHLPVGRAVDVSPDGSPHPVYRAGFALSIRLPETKPVLAPEPEAATETAEPEPQPEPTPEPETPAYEI